VIRAVTAIAAKELREGLRNRWILAATALLGALALALAFLGGAPSGATEADPLAVMVVSLSSLTIFLIPLIALLLSHDAIVGEAERGTLALLLSHPVARSSVVLGKFLGHLAILAFATVVGYGLAAAALLAAGDAALAGAGAAAFASMLGSSVLLGAAFLALGYLVSAASRARGAAAGVALGVWLLFVLVYDMALLGALVADEGGIVTPAALDALLLLNPADAYRLFNLAGSEAARGFSGLPGLAEDTRLTRPALLAALLAWTLVPLVLAGALFARREP
jgi:Cu-processing system permease protein